MTCARATADARAAANDRALGWLRLTGAPTLFDSRKDAHTPPGDLPGPRPCVALILGPSKFDRRLNGQYVAVYGERVAWESLPMGPGVLDKLRNVRYYRGRPTYPACGAKMLVVKEIRLAG